MELCKALDVHVAKSRCGFDAYIAKNTCRGVSLIDYVIMSTELCPFVSKFEVMNFDPLISDSHNAVPFIITQSDPNLLSSPSSSNRNDEDQTFTWAVGNANVLNDFKREIDAEQIQQVSNDDLDLLLQGQIETIHMEERVNDVCGKVSKIPVSAAGKSGMIMTKTAKQKDNKKRLFQPWFNDDCKVKRKNYLNARHNFRRFNSQRNHEELVSSCKTYKKQINKQFREYQNSISNKLRNLRHADPKAYWNMLN